MNAPILLDYKPQGVVLSASQIGRWDDCQRWWAWQYIAKIRTPPHPSAVLGSRVHKHLEAWLRDATPPQPSSSSDFEQKAAKIAKKMITTLINNGVQPAMGSIEKQFWIQSAAGHFYTGYIDWAGIIGSLPTVTDHKTSGNLDWAKTEADLHNDIQGVLYAVVAMLGFGTDTAQLFWNYGETKERSGGAFATQAVKTVVHLPVIAKKFENVIEPVAAEIIYHRHAGNHPLSFPPSPRSCGNYGGCPHRGRCNLTDQEMLGGLMDNGQGQSMADRMAAQTAVAQPQQQPQYAAPPQQPQVQTTVMPPQGQQPQQPQYAQQPPPPPQQQYAPQPEVQQPAQLPQQGQQPQGQFAPPPPEAGVQLPQGAMPMLPPGGELPQPPQQAYAPTVAPNPPETGTTVPEAPAAAPGATAGPGRPKGSRNTKKTMDIDQQVFLAGIQGGCSNPTWNGTVELLTQAGEAALQAYKAKFGK